MRLRVLSTATVLALATLVAGGTPRANAETVIHAMLRTCPNHTALATLNDDAARADAANDPGRYAVHRAVAREFEQCSRTNANPRFREAAKLAYVASMLQSVNFYAMRNVADLKKNSTVIRVWQSIADNVAATTRYPDVKGAATGLGHRVAYIARELDAKIAQLQSGKKP